MIRSPKIDRGRSLAGVLVRCWLSCGLLTLAQCGARSAVPICEHPGETRTCANDCGTGTQICQGGIWQACQNPIVRRACSNACGSGEQTCSDGTWSACEVPVATRTCTSMCGVGRETCTDGTWGGCDAPQPRPPALNATVRDFTDAHPDFEHPHSSGQTNDAGIVAEDLGPDDKPVYIADPDTSNTSGATNFDEWYRNTPDVNETTTIMLALTPLPSDPTIDAYDNDAFFPIDGALLGNQDRSHNYDFTLELAARFRYTGGETFRFASDDDLWVFLNQKLVIDLGGLHETESASVNLDEVRTRIGIEVGGTYPMHLFFAERHVISSVLHIELPAADVGTCN